MSRKNIIPGDKIKIYPIDKNSDRSVYFTSQVEEQLDSNTFLVSAPMKKSNIIPLHINEQYFFDFYTKQGLYRCKAEVMKRIQDYKISMLQIKINNNIRKIQRRNFFRVDCLLDLNIENFNISNVKDFDMIDPQYLSLGKTSIVNISGGGIKFSFKNKLPVGIIIDGVMEVEIKSIKHLLNIECEVIDRELKLENGYIYRAKFNELSSKDREIIVQYVFNQQLKQKGK